MTISDSDEEGVIWSGKYSSILVKNIQGQICSLIKPKISPEGILCFSLHDIVSVKNYFEMSFSSPDKNVNYPNVTDIQYSPKIINLLKFEVHKDETLSLDKHEKLKCTYVLCEQLVKRSKMRAHILLGHFFRDPELCGFCGRIGCRVVLYISSGSGENATWSVKSN